MLTWLKPLGNLKLLDTMQFLIQTNDNLNALGFYQKRGFELVAVHRGAVNISRLTKPWIPLIGSFGIPIRDEIELELILSEK